jgi:hypothetical protein
MRLNLIGRLARPALLMLALVCAATVASPPARAQGLAADWRADGPRTLLLTFRVAPGARNALRGLIKTRTLPQLEALRASGQLESYRVLANRYVDSASWDAMEILTFKSAAALAQWRLVEAKTAVGLPDDALKLVTQVETVPSDLMFGKAAAPSPNGPAPVYLVVPYDYLVPVDDYLAYLRGYLIPQVDGWMGLGVLSGYGVYLPRYPAGRAWSTMIVYAYNGDTGLAQRDMAVRTVRARLAQTSASWKAFSDNKAKIRDEKLPVVADEITLH